MPGRSSNGLLCETFKRFLIINDLHCPAAKDIRRTDHNRVADIPGHVHGLFCGHCRAVVRLDELQSVENRLETLPVFGQINAVRLCSKDGDACCGQGGREGQGRLASKLDNNPFGPFLFADIQDILSCKGLEIELVRGIIVCADRLGV